MDKNSSVGAMPCSHHHPHHHPHQHFQILHSCPLHSYMLHHHGGQPDTQNVPRSHSLNENFIDSRMTQDEGEDIEDEEEEPIFVLTDEWREFFAKSEAKRRQAKKHAKKKGKSKMADQQLEAGQYQGTDCNVKSESAGCLEIESVNQQ